MLRNSDGEISFEKRKAVEKILLSQSKEPLMSVFAKPLKLKGRQSGLYGSIRESADLFCGQTKPGPTNETCVHGNERKRYALKAIESIIAYNVLIIKEN